MTIPSPFRHTRVRVRGRPARPPLAALFLIACVVFAQASFGALAPGDYDVAVTHQGIARNYLVHVPPQAGRGRPLPLVMNFHGAGSNAEVLRSYTRMDRASDRDGYI